MKDQDKIPEGKFSRGMIIGSAAARSGLKKIGYLSKKPFLSEEMYEHARNRTDESIAKLIFNSLSKLRGTTLKAAQMLAMEMELLPEIYQKELGKSASQVPPINRALIRKIISSELGFPPEKIFDKFEMQPFAAASFGQVHRAVTKNGEEVAVKVQYPGMAQSIESDIKLLRGLLKITRFGKDFDAIADEVHDRIVDELDYEKEAENMSLFYNQLDNVIIPEVYADLSSKKVITTERIEGMHLDEWLKTDPPQEERNRYGQLLVDVFYDSINELKVIHGDPNFGNYLFRKDERLGIIDFGCIVKIEENFLRSSLSVLRAVELGDMDRIIKTCMEAGIEFHNDTDDKDFRDLLLAWIDLVTKPLRDEYFDYGDSKKYFEDVMHYRSSLFNYRISTRGDFAFYGRVEYGLHRMLQRLGAKVRMKKNYEYDGDLS